MAKESGTINWFQYNNIVGIVASALMIAGSFYGVSTKLEVLIERVSSIVTTLNGQNTFLMEHDTKLNNHEVRISVMEKEIKSLR
jgi:flagellar motor component MotA